MGTLARLDWTGFLDPSKGIMSYRVLLADPPWHHDRDHRPLGWRTAASFYPTMKLSELKAMRPMIDGWAAKDCALFLWAPHSHIPEAIALMTAWGFVYKTVVINWVKRTKHGKLAFGMGCYARLCSELCLLGIRGAPKRRSRSIRDVLEAEIRDHSRKPDEQYERIMALYDGPYLELFARQRWPGWDAWGTEVPPFATSGEAVA